MYRFIAATNFGGGLRSAITLLLSREAVEDAPPLLPGGELTRTKDCHFREVGPSWWHWRGPRSVLFWFSIDHRRERWSNRRAGKRVEKLEWLQRAGRYSGRNTVKHARERERERERERNELSDG